MVYIEVREGNLEIALRFIKRKLQRDGYFRAWKNSTFHVTKGSEDRRTRYELKRRIMKKNRRSHASYMRRSYSACIASEVPLDVIMHPNTLVSYCSQNNYERYHVGNSDNIVEQAHALDNDRNHND